MPELPDLDTYISSLEPRIVGARLADIRLTSPFLLRTAVPPISDAVGRRCTEIRRLGKRIVLGLEDDHFLVVHLMIAGRFRYVEKKQGKDVAKVPGRMGLAAFDFEEGLQGDGTLLLTEAGTRKRASMFYVDSEQALAIHDPGGLEVLDSTAAEMGAALKRENHTIKRSLTDPRILAGIGNAYSDEILHEAKMSPFQHTQKLSDEDIEGLHRAAQEVLIRFRDRMQAEIGDGFPTKVTAFREDMAVHGRYRQPCPRCGDPVQRIVKGKHETNYCPTCQTDGRILADRALSRLLGKGWPRTLEEMEELYRPPPSS